MEDEIFYRIWNAMSCIVVQWNSELPDSVETDHGCEYLYRDINLWLNWWDKNLFYRLKCVDGDTDLDCLSLVKNRRYVVETVMYQLGNKIPANFQDVRTITMRLRMKYVYFIMKPTRTWMALNTRSTYKFYEECTHMMQLLTLNQR